MERMEFMSSVGLAGNRRDGIIGGFRDYVNKRIPELREMGRTYVLFLIARECEANRGLYRNIEENYGALDGLTGKYIQFVLLGGRNGLHFRNRIIDGPSGQKGFYDGNYDVSINTLKYFFGVNEKPYLVFWDLLTDEKIPIEISQDTDIYGVIEEIVRECEKRFEDILAGVEDLKNDRDLWKIEVLKYRQGFYDFLNDDPRRRQFYPEKRLTIEQEIGRLDNQYDNEKRDAYSEKIKAVKEKAEACDKVLKNINSEEYKRIYNSSIDEVVADLQKLAGMLEGDIKEQILEIKDEISGKRFTANSIMTAMDHVASVFTLAQIGMTSFPFLLQGLKVLYGMIV
ncbi:MAG: hypothetical protein K6D90_06515 [Lachnospiraceae bacterium]|nr:hypothetical protein [Lachnospiraceae bacterium]